MATVLTAPLPATVTSCHQWPCQTVVERVKFISLKNLKVFTFLGFISNKDFLPIKSLRFGGRSSVNRLTSGRHTLGRLECNGQVNATSQMPSSCLDLWLSGQTQTGFYSIKGSSQQIELVYCNMTKPKTNSGNNSLKLKR